MESPLLSLLVALSAAIGDAIRSVLAGRRERTAVTLHR